MIKPSEAIKIYKPNSITEAYFPKSMTALEANFFTYLLHCIEKDENGKIKRIMRVTIKRFLGLASSENSNSGYERLFSITSKLLSKVIQIRNDEKQEVEQFQILSKFHYYKKQGYVDAKWSEDIIPYLEDLKRYVSFMFSDYVALNSFYSKRIFELIVQYQNMAKSGKWFREISIQELKKFLGIEQSKYKLYGHLKERVITSAVRDINDKTKYKIVVEEIKIGKKIESIKFIVTIKSKVNKSTTIEMIEESKDTLHSSVIYEKIKSIGVLDSKIYDILNKYNEDRIELALMQLDNANITDNRAGWFVNCLEKDYKPSEKITKKIKHEKQKIVNEKEKQEIKIKRKKDNKEYDIYFNAKIEKFLKKKNENDILKDFENYLIDNYQVYAILWKKNTIGLRNTIFRKPIIEYLNKQGFNILAFDEYFK